MENIIKFKKEYNKLLLRSKKIEKILLECPKVIPIFNEIMKEMNYLVYIIEKEIERKMTLEERTRGFNTNSK